MAMHDLNLAAAFADRVIVLERGKIAASTPAGELDAQLLSRVFELPLTRVDRPGRQPLVVPEVP